MVNHKEGAGGEKISLLVQDTYKLYATKKKKLAMLLEAQQVEYQMRPTNSMARKMANTILTMRY